MMGFLGSKADRIAEAHDAGMKAYGEGLEWWESPHVHPSSEIDLNSYWMAGWMCAKQVDAVYVNAKRKAHARA